MGEAVVIEAVRDFANRFLGRGEANITDPSYGGALKPNQRLYTAQTLLECEAPEDLATDSRNLYPADGQRMLRIDGGMASELRKFERPISALCALPDGGLAVALAGREVRIYPNPASGEPSATFADAAFNAINALTPTKDGTLIATDGSATCGVDDWARD